MFDLAVIRRGFSKVSLSREQLNRRIALFDTALPPPEVLVHSIGLVDVLIRYSFYGPSSTYTSLPTRLSIP